MTMVKAVAKSSFFHGRKPYESGDPVEVSKGEAQDLEKAGLVEITGDVADDQAKMEAAPENKMADAPANKSRTSKEK